MKIKFVNFGMCENGGTTRTLLGLLSFKILDVTSRLSSTSKFDHGEKLLVTQLGPRFWSFEAGKGGWIDV